MSDSFNFIIGQRFISQTEQELGLGTVCEFNHRMVKINFEAAQEARIYAKDNAPISRIIFAVGDDVPSKSGWNLKVESVQELNGLAIYQGINDEGEDVLLPETEVSDSIKLDRPVERLFSGHLDSNKWFALRQKAIQKKIELIKNPLNGLLGCRTSLLKHQLFIAHSVAKRFAPRVLLADEVGLGKTIEAGLIIHQQLLNNRAKRVLIVVPESLIHQWMVEMLRRFNLHFSVYDELQCQAIDESTGLESPFESSQLALVSLQFLLNNPKRQDQIIETPWDLLVVDEAHHLKWQPDHASDEYLLVEQLAQKTAGTLLLTATPEQLGKLGHFARLRLLDPHRFSSFDDFEHQESNYQPLVKAIDMLSSIKTSEFNESDFDSNLFNKEDLEKINTLVVSDDEELKDKIKIELIEKLLDQHGTGRILFRNTRSTIKGFPERKVHSYALENPYENLTNYELENQLCPETITDGKPWLTIDTRFKWLQDNLKELRDEKILLITAHKQTVLELAEGLRVSSGINAAVFHEDMSLIERDQSAAWFADLDDGAQIMLCSEIGSEGRNFQFAHHVIFFDLPINPDLLEQRIGRLDRIGQTETIHIHVPYLKDSAQEKLFKWHHLGLNLFTQICPTAFSIFTQLKDELINLLGNNTSESIFSDFIKSTNNQAKKLNLAFYEGRDRLLEYNSCRPIAADNLVLLAESQDDSSCQRFMNKVFDLYGVDYEDIRKNVDFIRPSESLHGHFPGLLDDGMSVTFNRSTALSNETLHYLTWEHPMVVESMEMLSSGEKGNVSLITLKNTRFKPSTILIEAYFNLEIIADSQLQVNRFVPNNSVRIIVDENHIQRHELVSEDLVRQSGSSVPHNIALQVIKMKQKQIKSTIDNIEMIAEAKLESILESCLSDANSYLSSEIDRLKHLSQVNFNVREDEIEYFELQKSQTIAAIQAGKIQMNGLRVLVCV